MIFRPKRNRNAIYQMMTLLNDRGMFSDLELAIWNTLDDEENFFQTI